MAGVWVEQDENGVDSKIVSKQPERGVQLAADGQEITPDIQARIDAVKAGLSGRDVVRGGDDAADSGGNVITNATAKGKK